MPCHSSDAKTRRENGASLRAPRRGAKQSSLRSRPGLLRRFAPRNDDLPRNGEIKRRPPHAQTDGAGDRGRAEAARFAAEKALHQKRYCNAFELWRSCRLKQCMRNRRCCGDANACLAKAVALDRVPHRQQSRTRQEILEATPRNIGAPERAARLCMPLDFYLERGKR
jgi:hypothetical protein